MEKYDEIKKYSNANRASPMIAGALSKINFSSLFKHNYKKFQKEFKFLTNNEQQYCVS